MHSIFHLIIEFFVLFLFLEKVGEILGAENNKKLMRFTHNKKSIYVKPLIEIDI